MHALLVLCRTSQADRARQRLLAGYVRRSAGIFPDRLASQSAENLCPHHHGPHCRALLSGDQRIGAAGAWRNTRQCRAVLEAVPVHGRYHIPHDSGHVHVDSRYICPGHYYGRGRCLHQYPRQRRQHRHNECPQLILVLPARPQSQPHRHAELHEPSPLQIRH